jgi:ribosomal protein L44E
MFNKTEMNATKLGLNDRWGPREGPGFTRHGRPIVGRTKKKTEKKVRLRCVICGQESDDSSLDAQMKHQAETGHRLYQEV